MSKIDPEINEWTSRRQQKIVKLVHKLKYNRTINNFFFFDLKSQENYYSWIIIVLSTLTLTLNLLDNLKNEPFQYFFTIIKIIMVIFSTIITLIAAWIKKQQYVERINFVDRYNQKINKIIEEIEVQLILRREDRCLYSDFQKKYEPLINEYMSTSPSMSPEEWKEITYKISVYYPECINIDESNENKLWPWHYPYYNEKNEFKTMETGFKNMIIDSYDRLNNDNNIFSCCYSNKKYDIVENNKNTNNNENV